VKAVTQRAGTEINTEALIRAGITTWITGTDSNRAIQSRYGKKDYQINTSGPAAAKAFNLAVDQGAVKKIVDEIAGMKKAKRDREAPHTDLIDRHNKARDKAQSTKDQSVRSLFATLASLLIGHSKRLNVSWRQ
jgi:hypothetical protein